MQQQITCIVPIESNNEKKRSAAYVRVSTNKDDQQNSFAAQYCHYQKVLENSSTEDFIDIYADEGISGTSMKNRDQFNRLIEDCVNGKIDRIYCKSVSRFARNTAECLKVARMLKNIGVTIYFEKENLDTATEESELRLTMMESQAQEESISLSRNVKIGILYRMENGEYVSSLAPYGYDIVDRKLVVNEEEAKIVRRIYAEYISGKNTKEIAEDLNRDGVKRKYPGGEWKLISVRNILSNERYIGDQLCYKRYHTDTFPIVEKRNKGEHDSLYIEDKHEAIITRETFEIVRQLREGRMPVCLSQNRGTAFLSGKIYCSDCGAVNRMVNVNGIRYWGCRTHLEDATKCPAKKVSESEIQRAFTEMYNKLKYNQKVIIQPMLAQLLTLKNNITSQMVGYAGIDEKILLTNEQIALIAQLKQKGLMDEVTYRAKYNELNNTLNSLRSKRRLFLNNSEADIAIAGIKKLSAIIGKGPNKLTEFDEDLFEQLIEGVTTDAGDFVKFKIIGGLTLNERIERKQR